MTAVCPSGHSSCTTDYCDQCGAPIVLGPAPPQATEIPPAADDDDTSPAVRQEPCPTCSAPRSGGDRYCEGCGHDFLAPVPVSAGWAVVVDADSEQFNRFAVAGLAFPTNYVQRRLVLSGQKVRIGRSRSQSDAGAPEIDLVGELEDPGISRLHAILERQEDGAYALRDLGSTNGTTVNDDPNPLGTDVAVPLAEGDRIRVGAWTTITVQAR